MIFRNRGNPVFLCLFMDSCIFLHPMCMKQTVPFTLHIPKPCSENWNQMTPDEKGRSCKHCQKIVVDFSAMSDQQMVDYFANTSGKTCGRFLPEQLNRITAVPASNRKPFISIAAMLAALYMFLPAAKATHRPLTEQGIKPAPDTSHKAGKPERLYKVISGIVTDDSNVALPGAVLKLKGTNTATVSDNNGQFRLNLPENLTDKSIKLVVTFIGYDAKEMKLSLTRPHEEIRIKLVASAMIFGEVAVIKEPSIWQKLADKIKTILS